jgi:hypothetical protein
VCVDADLQVSKNIAPGSLYRWGITKDVDRTEVHQSGTSADFNYTVNVTHDAGPTAAGTPTVRSR